MNIPNGLEFYANKAENDTISNVENYMMTGTNQSALYTGYLT